MNFREAFLYNKLRSNFLFVRRDMNISHIGLDLLMYCRWSAGSDGWILYGPLREFMYYGIKRNQKRLFNEIVTDFINADLLQMRSRMSHFARKKKALSDDSKSGHIIEYRLTLKAMDLLDDFDRVSSLYIEAHLLNKKLKSTGVYGK